MKYGIDWFEANTIKKEHTDKDVRQVYCWLETNDNMYVIVSKDNLKWQLPGGHPRKGESFIDTLIREVYEETNISLSDYRDHIKMFGYNYVKELGQDNQVATTYLQLRFYAKIKEVANDLVLKPNESLEDTITSHIKFVKTATQQELEQLIPWLNDSKEYASLRKHSRSKRV